MLEIKDVTKLFDKGTPDEKCALAGISLTVPDGEFVTVIGANGAGKSTLFGAIAGSFMTDSGSIFLGGEDITLLSENKRAKRIGRLFQDPMRGTAPEMTVIENLALAAGRGGWFSHITKADREFYLEKLAELGIGLEDRPDKRVGLLSGGQRQALTLIMATINPPELLLLDEHTAALDPATAEKVMALTEKAVRENHLTCLMITHNMQAALDHGDRTLMMNAGKIIYDTKGDERKSLTVNDLLLLFKKSVGSELVNDRMLLS